MRVKIKIPRIPEEEKTLIVSQLLEIIEQLSVINQQQEELIQQLKNENAHLKNKKPRPKMEERFKRNGAKGVKFYYVLNHIIALGKL